MRNFFSKRNRVLLNELVRTDFKLRYQGSTLGYVWSLLRPLLLFIILYLVFAKLLKTGNAIPHYAVYLLLGIVLWNYFLEVSSGGLSSIVGRGELLRKINFPKYVIIFAGSFSALINLFLNFVVIGIFMAVGHVIPTWHALLLIPLIAELFIVSMATAFILSALFVKFRDLSYIWEVIIQAGFYATPILYPLTRVPHRYAKYLILNPLAQIFQDARYVLVTKKTENIGAVYPGDKFIWLIPVSIIVILAVLAALYFRNHSKSFAEEV
jgi:ABC-2 type transport system permease protein